MNDIWEKKFTKIKIEKIGVALSIYKNSFYFFVIYLNWFILIVWFVVDRIEKSEV